MLRESRVPLLLTAPERQALAELAGRRGEEISATLRDLIYREASRYGLLPEQPPVVKRGRKPRGVEA